MPGVELGFAPLWPPAPLGSRVEEVGGPRGKVRGREGLPTWSVGAQNHPKFSAFLVKIIGSPGLRPACGRGSERGGIDAGRTGEHLWEEASGGLYWTVDGVGGCCTDHTLLALSQESGAGG